MPRLALIAGPTASGKSDLALRLARAMRRRGQPTVIINADSAQVYADLAVLSARPSSDDCAEFPHRLFGSWDGAQACSAADWSAAARAEIASAHHAGAVPILVGGTGLYIRTLLDGIAPVPAIDPAIRAAVRALPVAEAHAALALEDPDRAARLHPSDTTRVARALEVVRSTGVPLAQWQARREGGIGAQVALVPVVLTPARDWLRARIAQRFALMWQAGATDEVQRLLARGLDPALPVMRAIGVREVAAFVTGAIPAETAQAEAIAATNAYAKRQDTWHRHQCPPDWLRVEQQKYLDDAFVDVLLRKLALDTNDCVL